MRLALLLIVLVLGSVIGTIAYLGSQEPSNGQIFHENQVIHAPLPLPTSDQCTLSVVAGFGEVTERPWCR